jgi:leucine-zipper-like transcriptional regulator 1
MLTGEYMESRATEIVIGDVRYAAFIQVLEYVYSDEVEVTPEIAMELFQAADRFGLERLKRICENCMIASITIDSAANVFYAADIHNAVSLKQKALNFILKHFDEVSRTPSFEEVIRNNVDLIFEILRSR